MVEALNLPQTNTAEMFAEERKEAADAAAGPPTTGERSAAGTESKEGPEKPPGAGLRKVRGPKRRTKTGCLTCRKRRIKCGEEKPRCNNCIKAKRECEGYTQPVIFKNPLGTFGTFQSASLLGHDIRPMRVPLDAQQQGRLAGTTLSGSQPRLLAPRMPNFIPGGETPLNELYGHPSSSQSIQSEGNPLARSQPFYYPPALQTTSAQRLPTPAPDSNPIPGSSFGPHSHAQNALDPLSAISSLSANQFLPTDDLPSTNIPSYSASPPLNLPSTLTTDAESSNSLFISQLQQIPQALRDNVMPRSLGIGDPFPTSLDPTTRLDPSHPLLQYQPGSYELEDDGYYDVDSDEEMNDPAPSDGLDQLQAIMSSGTQDARLMRSFTTFLNEPNVLASYRPSMSSHPLNNPKTARIWVHFIHATGPSISIWERHFTSPIMLFSGNVPVSQQGIWTYIMPLKSLEHPALLHAILALSSLHIAKLQQAPLTISIKHYQYAIRRIAKAVGLPLARKNLATLAATLTLGFYEVLAADHSKWNNHVAGAAQLIKEIDLARQTRDLRAHRRAVRSYRIRMAQLDPWFDLTDLYGGEDDPFAEREMDIEPQLISTLLGREVDYDLLGHVDTEEEFQRRKLQWTPKDIENFRIQMDLYWWYLKQDVFQSLISGNPLYLPFERWTQCPPRGGLGKRDAIYASFDHLVLLLARTTEFAVRDRKRKIRFYQSSGGEWRPNPGFFRFMGRFGKGSPGSGGPRGGPPQGAPSRSASGNVTDARGPPPGMRTPTSLTGPPPTGYFGPAPSPGSGVFTSMPGEGTTPPNLRSANPMYGMLPSEGPVAPPTPFMEARDRSNSPPKEAKENESTEAEAEDEWEEIRKAFEVYASSLGSTFSPLPADSAPPISTPFGPALQYRSHQIAVLWAFYYAGRLILYRMHPSMPPAAMVAASVAASVTEEDAQRVGRIAAGIYYPQRSNLEAGSLNPTLGAALTEMTVPLFFAAVQFTNAVQRGWTVAKLRDIARLTGWQTAASIAGGCEVSWYTQYRKGQGPPYEYTANIQPDHINENIPRLLRSTDGDAQNELNPANERRFVRVTKAVRTHWAMGLLEMESDLANLSIDDEPV